MHAIAGDPDLEGLTRLLQLSVLPVVLISAISLLLLSVSNRLGRLIDRGRTLVSEIDREPGGSGRTQLSVILRRAEFLRASACCLVAGIFFSGLLILALFVRGFGHAVMETVAQAIFILDLLALLAGSGFLLGDVLLSLKALKLEAARLPGE